MKTMMTLIPVVIIIVVMVRMVSAGVSHDPAVDESIVTMAICRVRRHGDSGEEVKLVT